MAENRSQVKKDDICQKWQEMDFRVFLVMVIEVARKTMAENGRKWQKMGCRGKMAGNGFPRVSRRGHRGRKKGGQVKMVKMVENGLPRLFGRKWISARFTSRLKMITLVSNNNHNRHGYRTFQHSCFTHEC